MKTNGKLFSVLAVLGGLAACDGSGGSIVGSWKLIATDNVIYTFQSDGVWLQTATATDAATHCTQTRNVLGSYSTSGSTLTTTPMSATVGTSGCTDPSQNAATHNDPTFPGGQTTSQKYEINGNTLTLTGPGGGTMSFTRQ